MRILLVGGGSGGHVTPLSAVANELLKNDRSHRITVVTNKRFLTETRHIFSTQPNIKIKSIFAGKLRRYHGKSVLWHLTHLPTVLLNIRDVAYSLIGTLQSAVLLMSQRPDVVFCKGGYVCIPVGYMAHILRIPIIIHDSDTRPGLTNRILSKWAKLIGTGMPTSFYPYETAKMRYIGMPVNENFTPINASRQSDYKNELGFAADQKVLLVTGGGNGAESLNALVSEAAGELISDGWGIVHLAGRGKADSLRQKKQTMSKNDQKSWQIEEFIDMVPCMLAADVIVARTSASTLQEAANAKKTIIGIPSPYLKDQQLNAAFFSSKDAIVSLDETSLSPSELYHMVVSLGPQSARSKKLAEQLAERLHSQFAKPNAARELAAMIEECVVTA